MRKRWERIEKNKVLYYEYTWNEESRPDIGDEECPYVLIRTRDDDRKDTKKIIYHNLDDLLFDLNGRQESLAANGYKQVSLPKEAIQLELFPDMED